MQTVILGRGDHGDHVEFCEQNFDYLISQNWNFMFDISLFRVWWKCLQLETLVIDTNNPVCLISISIVHTFDCLLSFPLEIPALGSLPTNKSFRREMSLSDWLLGFCKRRYYDWLNFKHFLGYQIWVKLIYRLTKSEDLVLTSIFTIQLCTFTYKYQRTLYLLIFPANWSSSTTVICNEKRWQFYIHILNFSN